MKRFTFTLLMLMLAVSACAPGADSPGDAVPAYPNPSYPNPSPPSPSYPSPSEPQANDFSPKPGDDSMMRGAVYLDSVELLTLESFPLQFTLALKGNLPTPCDQLRVEINPPDAGNKVIVDVYSVIDPAVMCIQVLAPFEANVPLGSFPQGKYTLWVNGEMAAEFEA
jgi:hypothetical protein